MFLLSNIQCHVEDAFVTKRKILRKEVWHKLVIKGMKKVPPLKRAALMLFKFKLFLFQERREKMIKPLKLRPSSKLKV